MGFFGLLGSGNLGNDGSFEAVLTQLRVHHPDAVVDAMCMGPERMTDQYGVPAIPLHWSRSHTDRMSVLSARVVWILGKAIDAWRTASWVRRHDLVVVPGAGVLENSLPMRATGVPYAMFLLCASGKLVGTKVALLSVGATKIKQRPIRWLRDSAAHLAYYRSYRDSVSWDVMQESGTFAAHDPVYTDLVFSLPAPPSTIGDPRLVGVGIMAFFGGTDDRHDGQQIHERYIDAMTQFICWLVDHGYGVRLLSGDDSKDDDVIASVLADVLRRRPSLPPGEVVANPVSSLGDLLREIAPVGSVVGARYHNVVSGLRLSKPTISIGYSLKHDALMADMGVPEFALSARSVSAQQLIELFTELQSRSSEVRETLMAHRQLKQEELDGQFEDLASLLEPDGGGLRQRHSATSVGGEDRDMIPPNEMNRSRKDFWGQAHQKFAAPHFRLQKSARLINKMAPSGHCTLLDVGCARAALQPLLKPNIEYFGIDIAVDAPAPNLHEVDILDSPIEFDGRQFDFVVAQGLFEYLGGVQEDKFREIAQLLRPRGHFIVTYENFDHRQPSIYWAYNNVQSPAAFRASLEREFTIERELPSSFNWRHSQPVRPLTKAVNMGLMRPIPVVTPKLAVEYFFVCSKRQGG